MNGDTAIDARRQAVDELKDLVTSRRMLRVALDLWRRIADTNEAEVKRLRVAIARHRDAAGWKASGKSDVELWEVLDD